MTKTIHTLAQDINAILTGGVELSPEELTEYGVEVATALDRQLTKAGKSRTRPDKVVFASEIGQFDTCPRKLWFSYHKPELGEPLTGSTRMKFIYGDVIEETVITLAKAAGHEVTHEQHEVRVDLTQGYVMVGHIDAIIDGVLVDVKSTTTFGMKDFLAGKGGSKFGYAAQLGMYDVGLYDQGVSLTGRGWIPVDKQLGHVAYVEDASTFSPTKYVMQVPIVLEQTNPMLVGGRTPVPEGASGNLKLDIECSYCAYKKQCFPKVRTFMYSTGPTYLTKVVKTPKVPEVV